MLAWKKTQRFLTLALALALLLCCVPVLAVPAAAADTEMYLYNGVELPDINSVWTDKVSYPYACIMKSGTLFLTSKPLYCADAGYVWVRYTCDYLSYQVSSGIWQYSAGGTLYSQLMQSSFFSWSSYDVLYESGLTHLASTSPVPVNPPSSITSVSIVSPETVRAGLYIVASVDVAGTGDFDSSATLTLSGNTSSGTYLEKGDIGNNWMLFCGSDETASTLTLTAASVQDPSVTATYQVSVERSADPSTPTTPEGEEPIPTEENPTEPGEDVGGDSSDNEKDEATDEGNQGVGDLTDAIPDYSEGFMDALRDFTSAMSYTGTDAKLKIPAVMVPSLGDLVPGFQMMEEMELDFGAYVRMMPSGLMTLAQSLLTIALIVYCFKELYGTISYFLTLKGGSA